MREQKEILATLFFWTLSMILTFRLDEIYTCFTILFETYFQKDELTSISTNC
jgi:hypothetical protein